MTFDLEHLSQTQFTFEEIKLKTYQSIANKAKETQWIRLAGLPIGFFSSALTVIARVSQIFESIIKGIADIFGSGFINDCKFQRGVYHIGTALSNTILVLPFSILSAIWGIFEKTFMIALDPINFAEGKVKAHQEELNSLPSLTFTNQYIKEKKS